MKKGIAQKENTKDSTVVKNKALNYQEVGEEVTEDSQYFC
jgi:hypothetical protein